MNPKILAIAAGIVGMVGLSLYMSKRQGSDALAAQIFAEPPKSNTEAMRKELETNLAKHGFTGKLAGGTTQQIGERYLQEYAALTQNTTVKALVERYPPVQPRTDSFADRTRAYYTNDLRYRGWPGKTLAGNTYEQIYASYNKAYSDYTSGAAVPSEMTTNEGPIGPSTFAHSGNNDPFMGYA